MNYTQLLNYLYSIQDIKYANFTKPLLNSDYKVIGVRIPLLKQIIKENFDLSSFILGEYVEIDYIYFAYSLKQIKNIDEQLLFIENNIKNAKSWIITDCIPSYLKKLTFDKFYNFFINNYNSKYIYNRRMSYILALKFYKDENILKLLPLIKENEEYIVMMSSAWLLQKVAINYKKEVYEYLKNCNDIKLKRKTISKINDSYLFNKETKDEFKKLRNNNQ